MKNILTLPLLTLALLSGVAHAESPAPLRGSLTFVGMVVNDMCATPTSTWQQHVGRRDGISPGNAPQQEASGNCAGVEQTASVSLAPITTLASRTPSAGVITVTYN